MRLILDDVFNHCGRRFRAFHHLLVNGRASPYADWFFAEGKLAAQLLLSPGRGTHLMVLVFAGQGIPWFVVLAVSWLHPATGR